MENANEQYTLFDYINDINSVNEPTQVYEEISIDVNSKPDTDWKIKFNGYNLQRYVSDIETFGIEKTWDNICKYCLTSEQVNNFLSVSKFGELYEIALAVQDKQQKKDNGQYYTPEDVASVMSGWLNTLDSKVVCDVACGTGKLILTYLDLIGIEKVNTLLSEGNLYLYDLDRTALTICKTAILILYGKQYNNSVHAIYCDFLDKNVHLPKNCKVISNPPYAVIDYFPSCWNKTQIQHDTKELYSCFMEKIIQESESSVIITPYSFLGGKKFYSLRQLMNNYTGFIVSFDNVPGNIFCGRKQGIFNTNTANSVRASITVVKNSGAKGFIISPLIRFKNDERKQLLNCQLLETTLSKKYQLVSKNNSMYAKCHKELQDIFETWIEKSSNNTLKKLLNTSNQKYNIYMPNTCRYFTTASSYELQRTGMFTLSFDDKFAFEFAYCLINSSFAYWWWRIFDGGITYPIGLLYNLPNFIDILTEDDRKFFENISSEMISIEKQCIVTKLNAGKLQENIKFPEKYRVEINNRILKILGFNGLSSDIFNVVHKNSFFGGVSDIDV